MTDQERTEQDVDLLFQTIIEHMPDNDAVGIALKLVESLAGTAKNFYWLKSITDDYPYQIQWRAFCQAYNYPINVRRKGHEYINWIDKMRATHLRTGGDAPFATWLVHIASHQEGLGNEDGDGI